MPANSDILPARYSEPWMDPFDSQIHQRLHPNLTILDIGGGRHPTLPRLRLPHGTTYIGLDPDAAELAAAPDGSYDRLIVADAATLIPDLAGTVDLAVSWQVFEHVQSLERVLANVYGYLKPGGTLVSMFSGRWSAFAIANVLLPKTIGASIVNRIGRRRASNRPVFAASYDGCSHRGVTQLTQAWGNTQIIPFYRGASYFAFARPLLRTYLAYENAICRARWLDAATHYLLVAQR